MNQPTPPSQPAPPETRSKDAMLIIALLVVIAVTLGGLWLMERGRTNRAIAQAHMLGQAMQDTQTKLSKAGAIIASQAAATQVIRSELASCPATLDGQAVTLYTLPARNGRAIGFDPGDVILVAQPAEAELPTSQPSQP
jgi:hypothetical protein